MFTFLSEQFSNIIQGSLFYKKQQRYISFNHVSIDSRKYRKGDIFVTIIGNKYDSHQFLHNIFSQYATIAIFSNLSSITYPIHSNVQFLYHVKDTKKALYNFAKYWRSQHSIKTIAVSGSCGKTTIKKMLTHVLQKYDFTICSPGNYNNVIGCPLSVLQIQSHHQYGVFEIGSSTVGDVDYLSYIVKPSIAVVSMIGLEHMETFHTIENIIHTESETFSHLPIGGIVVLPRDSFAYTQLLKRVNPYCSVITFGSHIDSHVRLISYQCDYHRQISVIQISIFSILHHMTIPIISRFNIINFLAVVATGLSLDIPIDFIHTAFSDFHFDFNRFQVYQLKNESFIVDDAYNANPHSMETSIVDFNHTFFDLKKYLCIGDMLELGDISIQEHINIGIKIEKLDVAGVFLYGHLVRHTYDYLKQNNTQKDIRYFSDKHVLSQFLKHHISVQHRMAILFKCSNASGLHAIVRNIVDFI